MTFEIQASKPLADYLQEALCTIVDARILPTVCAAAEGAVNAWQIDLAGKAAIAMIAEAEKATDPIHVHGQALRD